MCIINNTILFLNYYTMEKRLREISIAIHKCEKAIDNAIAGHYKNEALIIEFMQKKIEKLIAEQEQIKARAMWRTKWSSDFTY